MTLTNSTFLEMTSVAAEKTLNGLTSTELATFYNQFTSSSIKKFADRATGTKRILASRKEQLAAKPKVEVVTAGADVQKDKVVVEIAPIKPVADALLKIVAEKGIALGGQPGKQTGTVAQVVFVIASANAEPMRLTFYFPSLTNAELFEQFAKSADGVSAVELTALGEAKATTAPKAAGKPAPAPKAPAAPKALAKPTRKEGDDSTVITLTSVLNPKKAGTAAFDRFELYVDGQTMAEALALGLTREDIRWDSMHKFITLETKPADAK